MADEFCEKLFDIGCVKFGNFVLKSGISSNVYLDLRNIISYPKLLKEMVLYLEKYISQHIAKGSFDVLCGVPYGALSFAVGVSLEMERPLVIRRKEAKTYGMKRFVDGDFKQGQTCLVIEDIVTSGSSIIETVQDLRRAGLVVHDAIVVIDRQHPGSEEILKNAQVTLHSLFTLTSFTHVLVEKGKISTKEAEMAIENISSIQRPISFYEIPFEDRMRSCKNVIGLELFRIMLKKKTNLCLAADLPDVKSVLALAENVGDLICALKIHSDTIFPHKTETAEGLKALKEMAGKMHFILIEDRKLADVGDTTRLQFERMANCCTQVFTAHSTPGYGLLESIQASPSYDSTKAGVFLIAQMSCKDPNINEENVKKTRELGEKYKDLVVGFVCQSSDVLTMPCQLMMTPGVVLPYANTDANPSQNYNTPDVVMGVKGADIAVVGKGITKAPDARKAALEFRQQLWNQYEKRVRNC